jgi:hypothetical protein
MRREGDWLVLYTHRVGGHLDDNSGTGMSNHIDIFSSPSIPSGIQVEDWLGTCEVTQERRDDSTELPLIASSRAR